jgi:hypothetical protein
MPIRITSGAPLLQVYDMLASPAFYRDVMEFELVATAHELRAEREQRPRQEKIGSPARGVLWS